MLGEFLEGQFLGVRHGAREGLFVLDNVARDERRGHDESKGGEETEGERAYARE